MKPCLDVFPVVYRQCGADQYQARARESMMDALAGEEELRAGGWVFDFNEFHGRGASMPHAPALAAAERPFHDSLYTPRALRPARRVIRDDANANGRLSRPRF